ncbi:MAG: RdgB/HAM1 family non-canonical purine NTP pyrophosphatase [Planctomycetota bacterium]|jgi:XTP/dITP diphosphohydrolase
MRLLVATTNAAKRTELEALLTDLPVELLTLRDFPDAPLVPEDGETPEENASKKASETALACGVHTVADDSGLFVDALDGAPGVMSARYAGPDPTKDKLCRKLLAEMQAVPDGKRGAYFRCCIAMADPDGRIMLTADGRVDGVVTREMRGEGGFGYDPVFYYASAGKTFAEMAPAEKNAVSHRGRALEAFRAKLNAVLEAQGG